MTVLQLITSVFSYLIWFTLLGLGIRKGLIRHFILFYSFVALAVLRTFIGWWVIYIFGYDSPFYFHFYYLGAVLWIVFQILLMIQVYFQLQSTNEKSHWWVLALFTAMMAWYFLSQSAPDPYLILHTVCIYFQVLFCLLLHLQVWSKREILLGINYEGMLYGLSLMVALQSFNYGLRIFDFLPVDYFLQLSQPLSLIPWIIYLFSMRRLDLPRKLRREELEEFELITSSFRETVRSLR